jgi:predicted NAD/FAD-binding protein
MLADILRFNRRAAELLSNAGADRSLTLAQICWERGCGTSLLEHYLLPMTAAIWSAPPGVMANCPAKFLVPFLHNHGLLQLRNRPQWLTIPGGSRRYVDALGRPLAQSTRLNCPVRRVQRVFGGVIVDAGSRGAERFDAVVFATHAPQSLAMLADPTPAERAILGAFAYQPNSAALHTDMQFMPRRQRAWASWNCLAGADSTRPPTVTYDLSRLQRLGLSRPLCVTLNPPAPVAPGTLIEPLAFEHPVYSAAAVAAQSRRDELHRDGRTYYCGAYWGYGFHEDGVNSALAVASAFGATLDDLTPCTAACTSEESLTCGANR